MSNDKIIDKIIAELRDAMSGLKLVYEARITELETTLRLIASCKLTYHACVAVANKQLKEPDDV